MVTYYATKKKIKKYIKDKQSLFNSIDEFKAELETTIKVLSAFGKTNNSNQIRFFKKVLESLNNGKKAVLVRFTLTTRIIVDSNTTEDEIIELATKNCIPKLINEPLEHLDGITDDVECLYDPEFDN